MMSENEMGWAEQEFDDVNLGDKRLNARLIKICDRFSESPESPINQACEDWAETKAAYRFFQNDNIESQEIIKTHKAKTMKRAQKHKTVLAIQDTSYCIYTHHPKTKGLGKLSLKKGKNIDKIYSNGLIMHTCLGVSTTGLPIGLFDQKISVRTAIRPENERKVGGRYIHDILPIEEKESYKWLESLIETPKCNEDTQIITVCDREADIYDFFRLSDQLKAPVLVRASQNRTINKSSRYTEKNVIKLWDYMLNQTEKGTYDIEIPRKQKTKHSKEHEARTATVSVKFAPFRFPPPRNHIRHCKEKVSDINMFAVYVYEVNPPDNEDAVEWMLLTNIPVNSFEEAYEKVSWYCLRWRIEMYFKVLKSGFKVEDCRLGDADRLIKYLTVMSIVAWRLFNITLMARTNPETPCTEYLANDEWKVLFFKTHKNEKIPETIPNMGEVVIWIARLGGFLARKNDGFPGTIALWRGWKRLSDLVDGWNLAAGL